jgi:hypothetical protein
MTVVSKWSRLMKGVVVAQLVLGVMVAYIGGSTIHPTTVRKPEMISEGFKTRQSCFSQAGNSDDHECSRYHD